METIQIVLESGLLRAVDNAARRAQLNRSALVRQALRRHLKHLRVRELEESDRRGYSDLADSHDDVTAWEKAAAWPQR